MDTDANGGRPSAPNAAAGHGHLPGSQELRWFRAIGSGQSQAGNLDPGGSGHAFDAGQPDDHAGADGRGSCQLAGQGLPEPGGQDAPHPGLHPDGNLDHPGRFQEAEDIAVDHHAAGTDGVHLDDDHVGAGHVAHPATTDDAGAHGNGLVEELIGLVRLQGVAAALAFVHRITRRQYPGRHPPHGTTAGMPIEQATAGGQHGRTLPDSQIGQSPGRFGGQDVGRPPTGAGHVTETLDRMHASDAIARLGRTGSGARQKAIPDPHRSIAQPPAVNVLVRTSDSGQCLL
jgi:hypothetical protein